MVFPSMAIFLCSATYKKIRHPIFLPEEHLLRQGNLLSGTRPAMKNEHLIPLDIRNEKTADRTIRRYHFLDSAGVGSHSFLSNARAGIDAILNHRIAVFQKSLTEILIVFLSSGVVVGRSKNTTSHPIL